MELKEQILTEAYQLFHQFGVKSVTMDDIAGHLGISKKTLYKFFTKKDELVECIANIQISQTEQHCCRSAETANDPIHELFLVLEVIRNAFRDMNPSLVYDLQKYYRKAWEIIEAHERKFVYSLLVDNLKRGIEAGLYREDLNIEILAQLRIQEIKMSFSEEIFPTSKYNLEELQVVLLEHFMLGITTLKGHELANKYWNKLIKSK